MLPSQFSLPAPALYPLGCVAINLEVIVCTGVLHSCTFPKLAGLEVLLSRTRLSPFVYRALPETFLCIPVGFS